MSSVQQELSWPQVTHHSENNAVSLPRRIIWQAKYETGTILRNGEQLLVSLVLPVLIIIGVNTFGLLDSPEYSTIEIVTPGVLAIAVMSSAFTAQGIQTAFDRRYGVLKFLATTPLGNLGHVFGKALAVLVTLLIQVAVILTVAVILGYPLTFTGIVPALIFLFLGALTFTSLGLLIAGTLRPEATLALTNLIWVLLGAAGGSVFPLNDSSPATAFLEWLPSAALGDGLRAALLEGHFATLPMLILVVWGVIATALTAKFYTWK